MKRIYKHLLFLLSSMFFALVLSSCSGSASLGDEYVYFYVEGDNYAHVEIQDGCVRLPDEPNIKGYKFTGWYYTNGSNKYKLSDGEKIENPPDTSFSVTAKFERDSSLDAHSHTSVKINEVLPTCQRNGNIQYWKCNVCKKTFSDEECKDEISAVELYHTSIVKERIPATCTESGMVIYYCADCGATRDVIIDPVHFYSNGICTECGRKQMPEVGDIITFGSYPQSEVVDESLKNALNGYAGAIPTSVAFGSWTAYKYYSDGVIANYMWYQDVEYGGEKYRGVYISSYRPRYSHSSGFSFDLYNAPFYLRHMVHWFKFEPIEWRIIEDNKGVATLLCETVIDSQEYNAKNNGNTYKNSTIREWLNSTFSATAFSSSDSRALVLTPSAALYTGETFETMEYEKAYLLSLAEYTNTDYGFKSDMEAEDSERTKTPSDYAICQRTTQNTDENRFNSGVHLYAPSENESSHVFLINSDGRILEHDNYGSSALYMTTFVSGVRPAVRIYLEKYCQNQLN